MKNNFILFVFSIITIFSKAQGPEYDEWYTLYDNNGFKVKVNIFVAEDKDVCINDKHISINYQYEGSPLTSTLYQEWEMPILGCNNQPYMLKMSVPLGPELKAKGEEGMEISAEELETGEFLSEVKEYFDIPKPTQTISFFNQKVLDDSYVPDKSGKAESIIPSVLGKLKYGQSITLTVDGGYLGKQAEWTWYKGNCKSLIIGTGKVLTVSDLTESSSYYVRAVAPGAQPTGCAEIKIDIDLSSTPPNGINGPNTVCVGAEFQLGRDGGILGPNSKWLWYMGTCSGDTIKSGDFYKVKFDEPGTYTFYLQAMHEDDPTIFTRCVEKKIIVRNEPNAPKNFKLNPKKEMYCEGEKVILQVEGELDYENTGAKWYFIKDNTPIETTEESTIDIVASKDMNLRVYSKNDICGQSESKQKEIKVYKRSVKPSGFKESSIRGKKKLLVSEVYLAEKSEWQWYRKKFGTEKKWMQFGEGNEITVKRSKLPAYFRVRAEGSVCNDTTSFVISSDGQMISKESKDAKWHIHHSRASKPATHWGFDLGYDAHSYETSVTEVNQSSFDRNVNMAGSGGFLALDFHPLLLEGFTFGLNGNIGFGNSNIGYLKNYTIEDTSFSVDYKYAKGGFGLELGTMISGNKGPMKLLFNWNRQYFMNDYSVVVSPGNTSGNETFEPINASFLHDNLGFTIRFGRYTPQNKKRNRGINWDFRFNLNNYSNGQMFDFQRGYFSNIPSWNPGMGLHIWVHRFFKLQFDVVLNQSLDEFFSNSAGSSINQARFGVAYSFDTFH